MSRHHMVALTAIGLCILAGCATSGLSPREVRGQDFSTYVFALYDLPGSAAGADNGMAAKPLHVPARVAVAQVGEVAPPQAVLDTLSEERALFASVQPVPGILDVSGELAYRGQPADYAVQARRAANAHIDRMRRYARDIGAEYLFLYGGTIDHATTSTALSLADLTVVGGFFVPSKRIQGVARASGALVDVGSGRVVLSVSADTDAKRMAPSFVRQTDELNMLKTLRDDTVVKLAEQLRDRMKSETAAGG